MPEEMMQVSSTAQPPKHTLDCHDVVQVVRFCPFHWASQLVAIATTTRVTVATCCFGEDCSESDGIEYSTLREFHHGSRIITLAWSPESSLMTIPNVVKFCTGGSDRKVRLFTSDLKSEDSIQIGSGHTDYVNDVTFDPDKGDSIASVSDDHTCRIWGRDMKEIACLPLTSPGMAVKWHQEDPHKMMVAEKRGVIIFFNVSNQQPIMSLDCGHTPLLSADWSLTNVSQVAAVAGSDWFIFDRTRTSQPMESKTCHSEGGRIIKWSRSHGHLLATIGSPGSQLNVYNVKTNQVLITHELPIANGISWHCTHPIIAVAGDKKLLIWSLES